MSSPPRRTEVVPEPLGPLIHDPSDPGYNLPAHAHAVMLDARRECQPQVRALFAAGWLFILPDGCLDPEPWQWRWRRPSRRKGMSGRLFASTGQAYNALIRQT